MLLELDVALVVVGQPDQLDFASIWKNCNPLVAELLPLRRPLFAFLPFALVPSVFHMGTKGLDGHLDCVQGFRAAIPHQKVHSRVVGVLRIESKAVPPSPGSDAAGALHCR